MNSLSYKDIIYSTTANSLDYVIKLDGDVIFRGGAVKSPKKASIELNVSKIIRNYIQENFADIRDFTGSTFEEPGAFGVFELYKLTTEYDAVEHTNYTVETLLETYNILLGFDYQGEWNGEACIMTRPVNGHIDPRMKIFCTQYSPVSTSIVIDSEQPVPPPSPYENQYLTFDIISGGTISWFATDSASTKTISYRKNGGDWTDITSTTGETLLIGGVKFDVSAGDIVEFKGNNNAYGTNWYDCSTFWGSTAIFNVYGNIMSLLYGDGFINRTDIQEPYTFVHLFNYTNVVSAGDLILPATTLVDYCYKYMFGYCYSLTTAPVLPATTLARYCYTEMFRACTSLVNAPALPATTLAMFCYDSMFQNCDSLTTAPELPATTLADYCYYYMFRFCTSLQTAPELPAATLKKGCYEVMFENCYALNYIKCLAETFDTDSTNYWVNRVSATGTFVKKQGVAWGTGVSGIPEGWTVQEE